MIRRITGIVLGVLAFLLVYWLTGLGTPSQPNWALSLLVGLVVALIWPWLFGIYSSGASAKRQDEMRPRSPSRSPSRQVEPELNLPGPRPAGARLLATGESARHPPIRPATAGRRARLPSAVVRPDHLGRRRPGHAAWPPARRRPDARRRRFADGPADRGRPAPAPAVLPAGGRLARSRPVAAPADDRGGPRPCGPHRRASRWRTCWVGCRCPSCTSWGSRPGPCR